MTVNTCKEKYLTCIPISYRRSTVYEINDVFVMTQTSIVFSCQLQISHYKLIFQGLLIKLQYHKYQQKFLNSFSQPVCKKRKLSYKEKFDFAFTLKSLSCLQSVHHTIAGMSLHTCTTACQCHSNFCLINVDNCH